MDRAKYIMFDNGLMQVPIIFPIVIGHSEMGRNFPNWNVVSAGFVQWTKDGIFAFGDSITLKVKSRPEDTTYMRKYLNLAPNDFS